MPLFLTSQVLPGNRDVLSARNGCCGGVEWSIEIYLVLDVKDVKDVVDRGLMRHNPSVVNARVGVSSVRVGDILL